MLRDKEIVLTIDGLNKLEKELEYLKTSVVVIAQRIKQAIEFGDITDNSGTKTPRMNRDLLKGGSQPLRRCCVMPGFLMTMMSRPTKWRPWLPGTTKRLERGKAQCHCQFGERADPAEDKISNESRWARLYWEKSR